MYALNCFASLLVSVLQSSACLAEPSPCLAKSATMLCKSATMPCKFATMSGKSACKFATTIGKSATRSGKSLSFLSNPINNLEIAIRNVLNTILTTEANMLAHPDIINYATAIINQVPASEHNWYGLWNKVFCNYCVRKLAAWNPALQQAVQGYQTSARVEIEPQAKRHNQNAASHNVTDFMATGYDALYGGAKPIVLLEAKRSRSASLKEHWKQIRNQCNFALPQQNAPSCFAIATSGRLVLFFEVYLQPPPNLSRNLAAGASTNLPHTMFPIVPYSSNAENEITYRYISTNQQVQGYDILDPAERSFINRVLVYMFLKESPNGYHANRVNFGVNGEGTVCYNEV